MIWHRIRELLYPRRGKNTPAGVVGDATPESCHDGQDDKHTSESMSDGHPWELLVRYGAGDAIPDELTRIASWRDESAEHARILRRVVRLAALSRAADSARHTEVGWERLQQRLERQDAASSDAVRVLPVRRRRLDASLPATHAPRRHRLLVAGVAAAALLAAGLAAGLAALALLPTRAVQMQEIIAHRGQRLEFGLPDGSHVVLGAVSRLRYAAEDFVRDRTLYLDGQGYFAVAHDTRHPFVVHARGAAVQAVGTEFGVRAYDGDSTLNVAVAKGRVLVRTDSSAPGTGTVLDLGDLGQMDSVGRMTVHRGVSLDPYLGWVRGRLIYDMAPPAEVVRDLERWYDVSIHTDGIERSDLRVSMTIDPTQPAPVSFQRLADVLDLRVVRTGNRVELVPRSAPVRRQPVR